MDPTSQPGMLASPECAALYSLAPARRGRRRLWADTILAGPPSAVSRRKMCAQIGQPVVAQLGDVLNAHVRGGIELFGVEAVVPLAHMGRHEAAGEACPGVAEDVGL